MVRKRIHTPKKGAVEKSPRKLVLSAPLIYHASRPFQRVRDNSIFIVVEHQKLVFDHHVSTES